MRLEDKDVLHSVEYENDLPIAEKYELAPDVFVRQT